MKIKVGQRIETQHHGEIRTGVVTRVGRSLIFVRLDGATRETWKHPTSLRVIR